MATPRKKFADLTQWKEEHHAGIKQKAVDDQNRVVKNHQADIDRIQREIQALETEIPKQALLIQKSQAIDAIRVAQAQYSDKKATFDTLTQTITTKQQTIQQTNQSIQQHTAEKDQLERYQAIRQLNSELEVIKREIEGRQEILQTHQNTITTCEEELRQTEKKLAEQAQTSRMSVKVSLEAERQTQYDQATAEAAKLTQEITRLQQQQSAKQVTLSAHNATEITTATNANDQTLAGSIQQKQGQIAVLQQQATAQQQEITDLQHNDLANARLALQQADTALQQANQAALALQVPNAPSLTPAFQDQQEIDDAITAQKDETTDELKDNNDESKSKLKRKEAELLKATNNHTDATNELNKIKSKLKELTDQNSFEVRFHFHAKELIAELTDCVKSHIEDYEATYPAAQDLATRKWLKELQRYLQHLEDEYSNNSNEHYQSQYLRLLGFIKIIQDQFQPNSKAKHEPLIHQLEKILDTSHINLTDCVKAYNDNSQNNPEMLDDTYLDEMEKAEYHLVVAKLDTAILIQRAYPIDKEGRDLQKVPFYQDMVTNAKTLLNFIEEEKNNNRDSFDYKLQTRNLVKTMELIQNPYPNPNPKKPGKRDLHSDYYTLIEANRHGRSSSTRDTVGGIMLILLGSAMIIAAAGLAIGFFPLSTLAWFAFGMTIAAGIGSIAQGAICIHAAKRGYLHEKMQDVMNLAPAKLPLEKSPWVNTQEKNRTESGTKKTPLLQLSVVSGSRSVSQYISRDDENNTLEKNNKLRESKRHTTSPKSTRVSGSQK